MKFKKVLDWFFKQQHIENWFKWLEWVTLSAAIGAAYWETKNNGVLVLVILSLVYIWFSAVKGVGYILWSSLAKFNLKEKTVVGASNIIGPIVGFGVFYILTYVFIGIFGLGK